MNDDDDDDNGKIGCPEIKNLLHWKLNEYVMSCHLVLDNLRFLRLNAKPKLSER